MAQERSGKVLRKEYYSETRKARALAIAIVLLCLKNILFTNTQIQLISGRINTFVGLLIILLFLFVLPDILKTSPLTVWITLLLSVLLICLQVLLIPENSQFILEDLGSTLIYGLIPFLIAGSIQSYEIALEHLKYAGRVIAAASVLGAGSVLVGAVAGSYSMSYGNAAANGVIIVVYFALKEHRLVDVVLALLGFLAILGAGSRGPLIPIVFLLFAYPFILEKKRTKKKTTVIVLLTLFITGIIVFFNSITSALYSIFSKAGITSRSLEFVMQGRFLHFDSDREWIYSQCIELIRKHPILGVGYRGLESHGYPGWSPHNAYLELLVYYGVIVGGVAIVLLVILWLHSLLYSGGGYALQAMALIYFSLYVTRTVAGFGMLQNIDFWILLAVAIVSMRHHSVKVLKAHKEDI